MIVRTDTGDISGYWAVCPRCDSETVHSVYDEDNATAQCPVCLGLFHYDG